MSEHNTSLQLTALITSPADVGRVRRELTALDDYLQAQRLREPEMPVAQLPKLSRLLDDFVRANHANLLHETVRRDLEQFLDQIASSAPVFTLSFAADPSSASLLKIVLWLRQEISPVVLVRVGLQPSIVAGCTLRTTNRFFDFSLRHHLQEQRSYLVEALRPRKTEEV